jgi:site-specific recombinase XerC
MYKDLRRLVRLSGPTPLAEARDRGPLPAGLRAGLRRSELVALDVRDLEESEHGLVVHLRRSKTDQEGAGEQRGVPMGQHPETCTVPFGTGWRSARSTRGRSFGPSIATAS